MHKKARDYSGYGKTETLEVKDIIREKYRGIRPAPGYPACPDHQAKPPLFELPNAQASTGIILTESNAMCPASSVSGWYFNHPESKYFATGKLAKDQLEDYATRAGQPLAESEKWLAPHAFDRALRDAVDRLRRRDAGRFEDGRHNVDHVAELIADAAHVANSPRPELAQSRKFAAGAS